jgi:DNA repair exonuclease SbcCD nuclease subunit
MTIKKIIHLADIHWRNFQRRDEYKQVANKFIYDLTQLKPDRVVIAGDLSHTRNNVSPELYDDLFWFLSEISDNCGKLIIVPGNHDVVLNNKERMDSITPLYNILKKDRKNIEYYLNSGIYKDEDIEWVNYSIFDNEFPTINNNDMFKIGLYHGTFVGAKNDNGTEIRLGVTLNQFDDCDMVLCGDIHLRQVHKTPKGVPVIMVGSLIQQHFGETISKHGYGVLDISDRKDLKIDFVDIENAIKFFKYKITDISDIYRGEEILVNY